MSECKYCLADHSPDDGCPCYLCGVEMHPSYIRCVTLGKPVSICPNCDKKLGPLFDEFASEVATSAALTAERDRLREEVAKEAEFKRGAIAEIVSLKNRLMDCQIERDAATAREATLRGLLVRAKRDVDHAALYLADERSRKLASEIESALEGGAANG